MSGHRPVPRSDTDQYLSVVVDELEAVSAALNGIRELLVERLPDPRAAETSPEPEETPAPVTVELKEPAPPTKTTAKRQPPKRG